MLEKGNSLFMLAKYDSAYSLLKSRENLFKSSEISDSLAFEYALLSGKIYNALDSTQIAKSYLYQGLTKLEIKNSNISDIRKAHPYNALGAIFVSEAKFDSALSCFEKALMLTQEDKNSFYRATIYNNLSNVYAEINKLSDAEKMLIKALEIYEANRENKDYLFFTCNTRVNLASVYADQKKYAESDVEYLACITLLDSMPVNEENQSLKVFVYQNLALNMVTYQYDDSAALDLLQKSLSISNTLSHFPILDKAMIYLNMGNACLNLRKYDDALDYTTHASEIYKATYGVNHPDYGNSLSTLAFICWCQGKYHEAISFQNQTYQILLANYRNTFEVLTEKDALKYAKVLHLSASSYLTLLWDGRKTVPHYQEKLADLIVSSKGQVTEGMVARKQSIRMNTDSTLLELMTNLHETQKMLAELINASIEEDEHDDYLDELAELSDLKDSLEQKLIKINKPYAVTQKLKNISSKQISAAIPAGSKLVEFIRFEYNLSSNYSIPRYMAAVMSNEGVSDIVDIGSSSQVDSLISLYLRHLKYLENNDYAESTYRQLSSALYTKLWAPFAESLNGASMVFISPDGPLNLISFRGLLDDHDHFLIEKYPIQTLSSGRDLIRLSAQQESNTGLLAVGDVSYAGSNFSSLPGTRIEVEDVVRSWKTNRNESVMTLIGSDASKASFLKAAEGKRIIHLATHGYYQPTGKGWDVVGENPFLTSGLVFAGGEKLTAEEVTSLQLNGTDLVVLTACESGLGKIEDGEGSYGIRRAFQMAGARTIISALWPVSDTVTANLMGRLYNAQNENVAKLLQDIALDYIQKERKAGHFPHPKKWAAFTVLGDWKMK